MNDHNLIALYCDACAELTYKVDMHHYARLPFDIESANKGESASICESCWEAHGQIEEEGQVAYSATQMRFQVAVSDAMLDKLEALPWFNGLLHEERDALLSIGAKAALYVVEREAR